MDVQFEFGLILEKIKLLNLNESNDMLKTFNVLLPNDLLKTFNFEYPI